jgi:hypothetical protein
MAVGVQVERGTVLTHTEAERYVIFRASSRFGTASTKWSSEWTLNAFKRREGAM